MSSRSTNRLEPCAFEDCGSRRFHIGNDGFTYCDHGHQQSERGAVVAEDTGEFAAFGRKAKRRESEIDLDANRNGRHSFSGQQALEHYLLCIQVVLRKQLRWLIDVQHLPEDLESIVRDLWSLRLRKLQHQGAYRFDSDTEGRSSQVFSSSQSDSDTSTSQESRSSRTPALQIARKSPSLLETISMVYLGILSLRIPVTIADLFSWINDGRLLYYSAPRGIPAKMRDRLPGGYIARLEPQELLSPAKLHRNALEVLRFFEREYGMAPPSLNIPMLVYRWTKSLRLPLEVYVACQRLINLVDLEIGFPIAGTTRTKSLRYPETRLMAAMVVVVKLLFPFEGPEGYARSPTDLCAIAIDWDSWVHSFTRTGKTDATSHLSFEEAFQFDESDCRGAAGEKLDAYLEWYQSTIATDDVREHGRAGNEASFRRALLKMFPLSTENLPPPQSQDSMLVDDEADPVESMYTAPLHPRTVRQDGGDDGRQRPCGSIYRRYRRSEDLNAVAMKFFGKVSELAGLSLKEMIRAVFETEREVQRWQDRRMRE